MTVKKTIITGFLVFLLLVLTISTSCGGNDMRLKSAMNSLTKITNRANFDDLNLTIYYISPSVLTRAPLNTDDLVNFTNVKKIVINGSDVEEHIDLFKQIKKDDLVLVKKPSRINARFCYMFESEKEGILFSVAMWGNDSSVFVNGLEVKENDIYYEVIMPFLSDDAKKDLRAYIGKDE